MKTRIVPVSELEKLEEARCKMIELFTKGLDGVELTRKMCEIEQVSRVMWRVAHEQYALTKNLPRPEHELAKAIIEYHECITTNQTKKAYYSMLQKAETCLYGQPRNFV